MPGYHTGGPRRNKGIRYPADPPTVDEIVAVMRHTTEAVTAGGCAMIVVLGRAGLRIQEALAEAGRDALDVVAALAAWGCAGAGANSAKATARPGSPRWPRPGLRPRLAHQGREDPPHRVQSGAAKMLPPPQLARGAYAPSPMESRDCKRPSVAER
jgi:hypothetical protein